MNLKRLLSVIRHPISIVYPHSWSNKVLINYIRSGGGKVGKGTRFISYCTVDPGRLDYIDIGENCCFSVVSFLAHDYSWYTLLESCGDLVPDAGGQIIIGNNCFVGYQSLILKGTTIGDNVIIGARSVVKGNIPSNTVWAGVPAKQICTIEEFYQKKIKSRLLDACYRRDHIREKKGCDPTISEMGLFGYLFLERTNSNYEQFFKGIEFNGIEDNPILKNYFFSSKPLFSSFGEFLEFKG